MATFPRKPGQALSWHQKCKTLWTSMRQAIMECSCISWSISKSFAPHSRDR